MFVAGCEPVERDVASVSACSEAGIGPRPDGVARRRVDARAGSWVGPPLAVEPALNLSCVGGDRLVVVVRQQPNERGEGAGVVVGRSIHLDDPANDVAHRVTVGVRRHPEHGGEELLGLTAPEAIGRSVVAACSGEQLRCIERSGKSSGVVERTPRRPRATGEPDRVEDLHLSDRGTLLDRRVHQVGLDR